MAWTQERSTVNQRIQIGAESTSALGTAVAANKQLLNYDFVFTPTTDTTFHRPTGHKYDAVQELNEEWLDVAVSGTLDYNSCIYPLASAMGSVSPVTHGTSTVAKDWIFTPPITGSIVPQTYTLMQGDTVTRAHSAAYGLFTNFAYKIDRKTATSSGKIMAQQISDGITLTASPTSVALSPVVGKHLNIYIDSTSAALGTTQLTRPLSIDFAFDSIYGPLWVLNRSTPGYAAHVDTVPKATFKLKVEADVNGMALLGYMRTGTTYYMRVNAQGPLIDNPQTVTIGAASAGTFTLTYKGQTTAAIAYNAAASAVQSALVALSTVGAGNVTVSGAAGGPYTVSFVGALATDATVLTGSGTGLTGGTFGIVATSQTYNTIQHDMAFKVNKPTAFSDDQGVFAIEWECTLVEDSNWNAGQAQIVTVTNLITAL